MSTVAAAPALAGHVSEYLAAKQKRLTKSSRRGYAATLRELVTFYPDAAAGDFEPPVGTELLEAFLSARWGERAPRTYNKNLSVLSDFFKWLVLRGRLHGDPTLAIDRARVGAIHRTTYSETQRAQIIATATDPRDRVALKLLLDYGIRKGGLQRVRFEHFDVGTRRIIVFTKGEKIHHIPIPDEGVWADLAALAESGHHYLLPRQALRRRRPPHHRQYERLARLFDEAQALAQTVAQDKFAEREAIELIAATGLAADWLTRTVAAASVQVRRYHDEQIGEHGLHDWWYRRLAHAGIVAEGVSCGERMHKARHSAGQRLLNHTGNLKAVQMLLGHANISVTGDHYTDWESDQLAESLRPIVVDAPVQLLLHERARAAAARAVRKAEATQ